MMSRISFRHVCSKLIFWRMFLWYFLGMLVVWVDFPLWFFLFQNILFYFSSVLMLGPIKRTLGLVMILNGESIRNIDSLSNLSIIRVVRFSDPMDANNSFLVAFVRNWRRSVYIGQFKLIVLHLDISSLST